MSPPQSPLPPKHPPSDAAHPLFTLIEIMARLRDPVGGCPWDIEQTFASIAPYTQDDRFDSLAKRVAAFWWGVQDQELVWSLSLARTVSPDPIADKLYLTHATEDLRYMREVKEWGYRVAVDYAGGTGGGGAASSFGLPPSGSPYASTSTNYASGGPGTFWGYGGGTG